MVVIIIIITIGDVLTILANRLTIKYARITGADAFVSMLSHIKFFHCVYNDIGDIILDYEILLRLYFQLHGINVNHATELN